MKLKPSAWTIEDDETGQSMTLSDAAAATLYAQLAPIYGPHPAQMVTNPPTLRNFQMSALHADPTEPPEELPA